MDPHVFRKLLLDASQFMACAVADGYGKPNVAHRLAQQLATVAGQGREMAQVLSQVVDNQKLPEDVPNGFAKCLEKNTRRVCVGRLLLKLAGFKNELVETAILRRKAGDESAELAFMSAAERLIEVVGEEMPQPSEAATS